MTGNGVLKKMNSALVKYGDISFPWFIFFEAEGSESVCGQPVPCLRREMWLMDQSFGFLKSVMLCNEKEQATSQSYSYSLYILQTN